MRRAERRGGGRRPRPLGSRNRTHARTDLDSTHDHAFVVASVSPWSHRRACLPSERISASRWALGSWRAFEHVHGARGRRAYLGRRRVPDAESGAPRGVSSVAPTRSASSSIATASGVSRISRPSALRGTSGRRASSSRMRRSCRPHSSARLRVDNAGSCHAARGRGRRLRAFAILSPSPWSRRRRGPRAGGYADTRGSTFRELRGARRRSRHCRERCRAPWRRGKRSSA